MSYQIVKSALYDATTKELVTVEKSNNDTSPYREMRRPFASVVEIYRIIIWVAEGCLQMRKWNKAFETLFVEYPDLVITEREWQYYWSKDCSYDMMMQLEQSKKRRAQHQCVQIVNRFKQLANIA